MRYSTSPTVQPTDRGLARVHTRAHRRALRETTGHAQGDGVTSETTQHVVDDVLSAARFYDVCGLGTVERTEGRTDDEIDESQWTAAASAAVTARRRLGRYASSIQSVV